MTCPRHPWDLPDGLVCIRTDEHYTGHIFTASDAPDHKHEDVTDEP